MTEYIEKSIVERMLWAVIMCKDERTIEEMLEDAPTVQAIPLDKVKQAREEMDKLASHKVRPISFDQAVAIDMCIGILDKLIESERMNDRNDY